MHELKFDTFMLAPLFVFSISSIALIVLFNFKFSYQRQAFCVCRPRCLRLHQLVYELTIFSIEENLSSEVYVLFQACSSSKHVTLR